MGGVERRWYWCVCRHELARHQSRPLLPHLRLTHQIPKIEHFLNFHPHLPLITCLFRCFHLAHAHAALQCGVYLAGDLVVGVGFEGADLRGGGGRSRVDEVFCVGVEGDGGEGDGGFLDDLGGFYGLWGHFDFDVVLELLVLCIEHCFVEIDFLFSRRILVQVAGGWV